MRKWVVQEAEVETVAAETIHGLKNPNNKYHRKEKSFFTNSKPRKKVCSSVRDMWERTCNMDLQQIQESKYS